VKIDDGIALLDDVIGTNPWLRIGLSTAIGVAVGLAGGRVLKSSVVRFALALSAKRILRSAFDTAFDAGYAAERTGYAAERTGYAAERSY